VTERARPDGLSLGLYGAAFVLVLAAGAFLGAAMLDELQETTMLWVSAVLSCGAVLLAVAALLLPRRSAG
jgi:predicted MFS family arabinose efflux permease